MIMCMEQALRTLIVDDEASIRFFLADVLKSMHFNVDVCASGEEALNLIRDTFFDLIMLDLRMGGKVDGLRVLEMAKWRCPETVVIILTAHGSLDSAVQAIKEGVDSYLLKPVEPQEIRETVNTVFARKRDARRDVHETVLTIGRFKIDLKQHKITKDGDPLSLTPTDFQILVHFARNHNRVIPTMELMQTIHADYTVSEDEARKFANWHVHKLRKKIEDDPADPQHLINVRGVGYRFVAADQTK